MMKRRIAATPRNSAPPAADAIDLRATVTFRLLGIASKLTRGFISTYTGRYGIGLPEWRTLGMIGQFGPLPSIRIAELAEMDRGAISRAVAALERRGLVRRVPDPKHGRRKAIELTGMGRRLHAEVSGFARSRHDRLRKLLSRSELAILDQVLAKLDQWARELESGMSESMAESSRPRKSAVAAPQAANPSLTAESRGRLLSELARFQRLVAGAL